MSDLIGREKPENKNTMRNIKLLFVILSAVILLTSVISYNLAAKELKTQLTNKCQALAATVAAIISENSDGYAAFLENLDMESEYYVLTKELMMNLKQVNVEHVTYIYTEAFVDENTKMYVIGGEDPSSPVYTGPGVRESMTKAEKAAYSTQKSALGNDFENTDYGERLSAYEPIFHKDTGEFLGLVGADIIRQQYNSIMVIFVAQTVITMAAALAIFALCMRWLSGNVNNAINKQRYEVEFARNIISTGRMHYKKMNELFNEIRVMRHDYKYHLNIMQELLQRGETEKANNYMEILQSEFQNQKLNYYCDNVVINALISNYAERYEKEGIEFITDIKTEDFQIPNYDICIVLGNLLENAFEACRELIANKKIRLIIVKQNEQLGIRVENSFNGIALDGLSSNKKDRGLGLKSVKAVALRYYGELVTEWSGDVFIASVIMSMQQ